MTPEAITIIESMKASGSGWQDIANRLNEAGHRTARGRMFTSRVAYNSYLRHRKRVAAAKSVWRCPTRGQANRAAVADAGQGVPFR